MKQLSNNVQTDLDIRNYTFEYQKSNLDNDRSHSLCRIVLTNRDYEILKFILEMKFSSIDEIHFKFFKSSNSKGIRVGTSYVIKRLSQLEKEGFLSSTRAFNATKKLFYGTQKAQNLLSKIYPELNLPRSIKTIDGRTVAHDYYLLLLRLKLEESGKSNNWISDRKIKSSPELYGSLGKVNSPDGIYTNTENQKVALELEVSVKSKTIYKDKVSKYVNFIRSNYNDPNSFKMVHYVVFSHISFDLLTSYSSIYKQFFSIEMVGNYQLTESLLK